MNTPQKDRGCICEDDNKLTQAFCPLHGAPAYRHTPHTDTGWEGEFDKVFKCNCMLCKEGEHEFSTTADYMKGFILRLLEAECAKVREEEHQFFLNILDGVDIADAQMGNTGGGTKAIRFALQSRSPKGTGKEN